MDFKDNSFPISRDEVNLGAGAELSGIIVCVEDGELSVTWSDNTVVTVNVVAGMAIDINKTKSCTVVAGMFHMNND